MEPKILFIWQSGNEFERILEMIFEVYWFLQLNLLLLRIKVYTHLSIY